MITKHLFPILPDFHKVLKLIIRYLLTYILINYYITLTTQVYSYKKHLFCYHNTPVSAAYKLCKLLKLLKFALICINYSNLAYFNIVIFLTIRTISPLTNLPGWHNLPPGCKSANRKGPYKMAEIDMTMIFDNTKVNRYFIVYMHSIKGSEGNQLPMYVGHCKLSEFPYFNDARTNSEWQKYCANSTELNVKILGIYEDAYKAYNQSLQIAREVRAHCNLFGARLSNVAFHIRCRETGEIYESAADACRKLSLSPPQLSNHLRGITGYKTVKGMTFERM